MTHVIIRLLQKPKMRDLHRVSAMAAVIITVFLMLEIPLMVITIIHAVKPQVMKHSQFMK